MRLSNSEHEAHPWRISEIAPDFRLEDAWALPAQGGADDFASLLEVMATLDPARSGSWATKALFSIRYRVGDWFGWDDAPQSPAIPDATEPTPGAQRADGAESTLETRLPADLRDTAAGLDLSSNGFKPLYRTDTEWASELSNRTVHAVMHLAWVEQGGGVYRGQMGVYVKPRGRLGAAYMAAIAPFRRWIVYPALMRQVERAWNARG